MDAPVLLIQWLKPNEYRETQSVIKEFAGKNPRLALRDVKTKQELISVLKTLESTDNCQFLFIGAHGVKDCNGTYIGIGKSATDYIKWGELWEALSQAQMPPVLWLGACSSARCAEAWSPFPTEIPVLKWLVGFDKDVYPKEIEEILKALINMTSLNHITYAHEEIPRLKKLIAGTCVQMHYPVCFNKEGRFVKTTDFPNVFNKTFSEHLNGK